MIALQFILLSKSSEVAAWKKEYEQWMRSKEIASCESSARKPERLLCLPTLLKLFGKNELNHLYPELYDVVKIVATLSLTVASCENY